MFDILHQHTRAVLFHSETAQTIAEAVQEAVRNGAHLVGAHLDGAHLEDAHLDGAHLVGANLDGIKGYLNSHDIFAEAVRRQPIETFTAAEWSAIGQIAIHRPCWDTICQHYADVAPHVLTVLAEAGFTEWQEHWKSLMETPNATRKSHHKDGHY